MQLKGFQSHLRHKVLKFEATLGSMVGPSNPSPPRQLQAARATVTDTSAATHIYSIHRGRVVTALDLHPGMSLDWYPSWGPLRGQVLGIATDWLPRRRLSNRCTHPLVLTDLKHRSRMICGSEALSWAHFCYDRVNQTPALCLVT